MRILGGFLLAFLLVPGGVSAHPGTEAHSHAARTACADDRLRVRKAGDDQYWMRAAETGSMVPTPSRNDCYEHEVPVPGVLHPFVHEDTTPLPDTGIEPWKLDTLYDYKGISAVRLWTNSQASHLCVDGQYYGTWERDGYYDWPEPYGTMTAREFFAQVAGGAFSPPNRSWLDGDAFWIHPDLPLVNGPITGKGFISDRNWGRPDPGGIRFRHYRQNEDLGVRAPYDGTGHPTNFYERFWSTGQNRMEMDESLLNPPVVYGRVPEFDGDVLVPRRYAGKVFCVGDRPAIRGVQADLYLADCSKFHTDPLRVDFANPGVGQITSGDIRIPQVENPIWRVCAALMDGPDLSGMAPPANPADPDKWTKLSGDHRGSNREWDFRDGWTVLGN